MAPTIAMRVHRSALYMIDGEVLYLSLASTGIPILVSFWNFRILNTKIDKQGIDLIEQKVDLMEQKVDLMTKIDEQGFNLMTKMDAQGAELTALKLRFDASGLALAAVVATFAVFANAAKTVEFFSSK